MTSELRARLEALADRMEPALMGTPPDCHDECAHGPCICSGARPVFAWSGVSPDDLRALLAEPEPAGEGDAWYETPGDAVYPTIAQPAASQGGDVEALAEFLSWAGGYFTRWDADAHPDHNHWSWRGDGHGDAMREVFREEARAILASDWLAARDAEVARAVGERIAMAIEACCKARVENNDQRLNFSKGATAAYTHAATIARAASEETR